MYTICVHGMSDIGAVIDDKRDSIENCTQSMGERQQFFIAAKFIAQLNDGRAFVPRERCKLNRAGIACASDKKVKSFNMIHKLPNTSRYSAIRAPKSGATNKSRTTATPHAP